MKKAASGGPTPKGGKEKQLRLFYRQKGLLSMAPKFRVEIKRPYSTGCDLRHQDLEGIYELILLVSADGGAYELKITPEGEDD